MVSVGCSWAGRNVPQFFVLPPVNIPPKVPLDLFCDATFNYVEPHDYMKHIVGVFRPDIRDMIGAERETVGESEVIEMGWNGML